ncbi:MAG: chemotaxis protein CheW [Candidatus Riflebacteria bacterium]|nr:chemotaxis protein CheW [Candidatus Riflebacteria bacterium]
MEFDIDRDLLLKEFIAESREQLNDLENDLLQIEEAGAEINEKLVNKVFRAAHSIKGASSLFDFKKMQELAHKSETVLDLIRSRVLVPNPPVVSALLKAFDKLREMIDNTATCEEVFIADQLSELIEISSPFLGKKNPNSKHPIVKLPKSSFVKLSDSDFASVRRNKNHLYFAEYNILTDIDFENKNLLDLVKLFTGFGRIVDVEIDFASAGTLNSEPPKSIPMQILFSTDIDPSQICLVLEIPEEKITLLYDPTSEQKSSPAISTPEATKIGLLANQEENDALPQPKSEVLSTSPETSKAHEISNLKPQSTVKDNKKKDPGKILSQEKTQAESTLRVGVDLLESLVNLAGELVLSRNQLREAIAVNNPKGVVAGSQRINLVTTELQEAIMRTRMQPIGGVFNKFPRLVHDLSKELKKEIQLQIDGKEVEMDKTLVEGLSDPLTHMVRNACDHGIETPEERQKSGKNPSGTIKLKACHEAGQVIIELSDDGKGIDPEKVAFSALKNGLISTEKLQSMSEKEKMFLIFLPGLSTAEKVSDVSGRGVGMDVVKTNLDRLGGKIEIESAIGHGSLFRIKLPLTLAIIPSLIFSAGDERFAIPQIDVIELLRIPVSQISKRIELIGNAEVLNLRGKLMPIIYFSQMLGVQATYFDKKAKKTLFSRRQRVADRRSRKRFNSSASHPIISDTAQKLQSEFPPRSRSERRYHSAGDLNVIVISAGAFQYGLVVDKLYNTEEIVVKPLGRHLKELQEYSGATIMGDGKVALIIDSSGLANKTNLAAITEVNTSTILEATLREKFRDTHLFLTFHNSSKEKCAVPLEMVLRVERIKESQIEYVGGRRTIQYRGSSLPLIALSDVANVEKISTDRGQAVIVSNVAGREIGLLAGMPVDVLETKVDIDQSTLQQKGIAGSAIIKEKTVLMIDLYELVQCAYPEWIHQRKRPEMQFDPDKTPLILLADDSDFFRAQVKRCIEQESLKVIEARNGEIAWQLLQKHADNVKVVVTDIDMPEMTGIELARAIRSDPRFTALPIIALTSLSDSENIESGKIAGISDYQIKLDRDRFLESLYHFLGETCP